VHSATAAAAATATASGDDGSATAAATAAAAAAAATAAAAQKQYRAIQRKLDGIEALVGALQSAQAEQAAAGQQLQANVQLFNSAASSAAAAAAAAAAVPVAAPAAAKAVVYRDPEDAAVPPPASAVLEVLPLDSLPVQARSRLEFGEHLYTVLRLRDSVTVAVARSLPPPPEQSTNAFRSSYYWDAAAKTLYVHARRLGSSGDFGLVLVHAAAHLKSDTEPEHLQDDTRPAFTQHFHGALRTLTQELFARRTVPADSAGDSSVNSDAMSGRRGSVVVSSKRGSVTATTTAGTTAAAATAASAANSATTAATVPQGFSEQALQQRIAMYAKASGLPQLSSFMDRYATESKSGTGSDRK
jgi:trimeric autotransporter adhesin